MAVWFAYWSSMCRLEQDYILANDFLVSLARDTCEFHAYSLHIYSTTGGICKEYARNAHEIRNIHIQSIPTWAASQLGQGR